MKKIIVLCALLATVNGCSSDSTTGGAQSDVSLAALNGTWSTACIVFSPFSAISMIFLSNGLGDSSSTTYSDTTCTTISMISPTETFTYSLGSDVTVDGSVAGLTTATEINSTGTTIGSVDFNVTDYDIIAINNLNTLYLGDSDGVNDGTTPALRPTQLSTDTIFFKQ